MIKHYWLEKNSPLKAPMIIELDHYSTGNTILTEIVIVVVGFAIVMLGLSLVYGR